MSHRCFIFFDFFEVFIYLLYVCESNCDRNTTLWIEEYLNKVRPTLKDVIRDFEKIDT